MGKPRFTALQAVLIRERLILYLERQRQLHNGFSIRKLIEAISFSEANADNPAAYREQLDSGARYDSAMALKNNTIGNFVTRQAAATTDENLELIRDFLASKGFVSPLLLAVCGTQSSTRIQRQFGGLASIDPRLQKFRKGTEGEYLHIEDNKLHQLVIAAPGRSKPFVSLRCVSNFTTPGPPHGKPTLNAINNDPDRLVSRFEGRVFLMPGDAVTLVEMCGDSLAWDGTIRRLVSDGSRLVLINGISEPVNFERPHPTICDAVAVKSYTKTEITKAIYPPRDRKGKSRKTGLMPPENIEAPWRAALSAQAARLRWHREAPNRRLIEAARTGDASGVLAALFAGADCNTRDPDTGRTAAHWGAAINSLEIVSIFAPALLERKLHVLKSIGIDKPTDRDVGAWARVIRNRLPLILDDTGCFASSLANVSTDESERNRRAMKIWAQLFHVEALYARRRYRASVSAYLDVWKPSPVMAEAMQTYAPPLPDGFSNPSIDERGDRSDESVF